MRHLTYAASVALTLGLAACGGGSSATSSTQSPAVAKADLPRDAASSVPAASLQAAAAANNAFAVDLFARLRATPAGAGNLITSPLSASLALTMAYAGAQGQTASEMAAALHLGAGASAIFDGQNALSQSLAGQAADALAADAKVAREAGQPAPSADDYQLQVVNSVWGERTYAWAQPFLSVMARSYGAGVFQEDFVHQSDPARLAINAWVSAQTADKIQDLLPAGTIDGTTRMVLVNAIHLRLPWANPFQASSTAPATFHRGDGTTVTAPFMRQGLEVPYVDDGQAQVVSLPLSGDLSVVFALPHGDLASYEAGLSAGSAVLSQPTQQALVSVSVPKVSFTSPTFSLAAALQAMGMKQAFDPARADFKGLCQSPPDHLNLYVSDVLQKAMLAMQETGVEAAAATAVVLAGGAAPSDPIPLALDRPFVVSIVDGKTGAVLFLGHVQDPTVTGS